MPFEERVELSLAALSPRIAAYRFELVSAIDRAKHLLASKQDNAGATILGEFAKGLIDPARYASIADAGGPLDVIGCGLVERAISSLEALSARGNEAFVVEVPYQSPPRPLIEARLEELGKVFSLSSLIELVRRTAYDPAQHGASFDRHPFSRWGATQRKLAPPLVIRLDGRDIDAFDLAGFIDGCVTLVLVVDGECAPAPLARLISPGTFVAQTEEPKLLSRLADFDGPAVVALMKGREARFIHDPRAGEAAWQRLRLDRLSDVPPRRSSGGRSAWQQRDDIAHLKSLAEQPAMPADSTEALIAAIGGEAPDPTDRLMAWLLDQTSPAPSS